MYMKYVYKKHDRLRKRKIIRYSGLGISIFGIFMLLYISFPLLSWALVFEPAFAANDMQSPIPKSTVLGADSIRTLIANAVNSVSTDYTNAETWFPSYIVERSKDERIITTYNISIPKLNVKYANVSTIDTDLAKHLVHYPGTALPGKVGNAVIFGHSTLPSLFNPTDYKTIFAKAHTLKIGDTFLVTSNAKEYSYVIDSITITTPEDTSIFSQPSDGSYVTLVTCTPPGTTWKRLIIKAKLNK